MSAAISQGAIPAWGDDFDNFLESESYDQAN